MADASGRGTQALLAGNVGGVLIASGTGTTSASANTAATVTHGARDAFGNTIPVANLRCVAFATANTGNLYQSAAPTATVIDVRSTLAAATPYVWFLFLVN